MYEFNEEQEEKFKEIAKYIYYFIETFIILHFTIKYW